MQPSERVERVGPEPIPEELYASRQLPVRQALVWVGRVVVAMAVVFVLIGVFVMSLYRLSASEPLLRVVSRFAPIPAMRVDGKTVLYRDYVAMLDGWNELSGQHGPEGFVEERVQDRLVQNVLLEALQKEMGVRVTDVQRETVHNTFLQQYASEADYAHALYEQFRWTEEEFALYVVEPLARLQALDTAVLADTDLQAPKRQVIDDLHRDVTASPDTFAELAMSVAESTVPDESVFLAVADYPEVARVVLMETAVDALTPVIELERQFVFYRVDDKERRSGEWYVQTHVVAVPKQDVYDVLEERLATVTIRSYLPE